MTDTVKIPRPLFCRRFEDRGGRVKPDGKGQPLKVRTRIEDSDESFRVVLPDPGRRWENSAEGTFEFVESAETDYLD